jgi:hypothetical protein
MGTLCVKHVCRKPGLASLALAVFGVCRRRPGELVFLDLRYPRSCIESMAPFFFQLGLIFLITLDFFGGTSGLGLGIDIL